MPKYIIQIILEILLLLLLFFNIFVLKILDFTQIFIVLCIFFIFLTRLIKYKRPLPIKNKDPLFIIITSCILMLGTLYFIGIFNGYEYNCSVIYKKYIPTISWLMTFLIVIITELIRYQTTLFSNKKEKKYLISKIIMISIFVLLDLTIIATSCYIKSVSQLCEFICLILVQSIAKNIFLNYLSEKYGYKLCLIYRFFLDLYIYFIPYIPKANPFIKAVLLLLFPYIVYLLLRTITTKEKTKQIKKSKPKKYIGNIILIILLSLIVSLISCEFKFAMLAVGSGSMRKTINKGDAIIYEKYNKKKLKIKEGDIIVFNKNNMKVVHRIIKLYSINKNEIVYQTKGDANKNSDEWLVTEEEIIGKVQKRIPWVAWPSVLLNELF